MPAEVSWALGSHLCKPTGIAFATCRCPLVAAGGSWHKLIAERGRQGCARVCWSSFRGTVPRLVRLLCIIWVKRQRGGCLLRQWFGWDLYQRGRQCHIVREEESAGAEAIGTVPLLPYNISVNLFCASPG